MSLYQNKAQSCLAYTSNLNFFACPNTYLHGYSIVNMQITITRTIEAENP